MTLISMTEYKEGSIVENPIHGRILILLKRPLAGSKLYFRYEFKKIGRHLKLVS